MELLRAKLKVNGRGELLPDTTLPFQLPVTAQLYASDGACWEAEFDAAETRRNEAERGGEVLGEGAGALARTTTSPRGIATPRTTSGRMKRPCPWPH
jgi:hypothetical protein